MEVAAGLRHFSDPSRGGLLDENAARGKGSAAAFSSWRGGVGVWLPFIAALSEPYDVMVPDHPGFGRSDTPEWLDQLSDLAYFYLDLIDG